MTCAFHISNRWAIVCLLSFVVLFSACSREEVGPLGTEFSGTERSALQPQNEASEQEGTRGGNTLRNGEVIEENGADNGGISDDGDDTGDSERNRKNKGNN
ncbi:MAG: hypothetical protein IT229_11180 [Flavobacteriales bacterium]|nr:hypothetical protein [Flavobacteriales bacterium]